MRAFPMNSGLITADSLVLVLLGYHAIGDEAAGDDHAEKACHEAAIGNFLDTAQAIAVMAVQPPIGEQAGEQERERGRRYNIVRHSGDTAEIDEHAQKPKHGEAYTYHGGRHGKDMHAEAITRLRIVGAYLLILVTGIFHGSHPSVILGNGVPMTRGLNP